MDLLKFTERIPNELTHDTLSEEQLQSKIKQKIQERRKNREVEPSNNKDITTSQRGRRIKPNPLFTSNDWIT